MKAVASLPQSNSPARRRAWIGFGCALVTASFSAAAVDTVEVARKLPQTPREFYNDGTAKLQAGKLREAEASFETAAARNEERVQTAALYNLGQVRYKQGVETLKELKDPKSTRAKSEQATDRGGKAITAADEALAGYDVEPIVQAYLQGRGARKELKTATEAVKKAMETYGVVLQRWQRAAGDFKSAYELRPKDSDAQANGEIMDQYIARLVDELNSMKMACQQCSAQKENLGDKMKKLKERMPEEAKKRCKNGDEEDEEEDGHKEPKQGQEEPSSKDGHEIPITPEDAARLLESLRLDANRKLPFGGNEPTKPRVRTGKTW